MMLRPTRDTVAGALGVALGAGLLLDSQERPVRVALSNSFGFGGTNCCLLFGQPAAARSKLP